MTLIKILNGSKQVTNFPGGLAVWCDRRSALGNPFELSGEESRDAVCDAYQVYFDAVLAGRLPSVVAVDIAKNRGLRLSRSWRRPTHGEFMAELARLELLADGPIGLGCWCHPRRCHCDTIAAYLMGKLGVVDENAVTQGSLF
jgi:hypothetical protein